jgi:hypothetical protein
LNPRRIPYGIDSKRPSNLPRSQPQARNLGQLSPLRDGQFARHYSPSGRESRSCRSRSKASATSAANWQTPSDKFHHDGNRVVIDIGQDNALDQAPDFL